MAQLKIEKLMVVPSTADAFTGAVSALRYLDTEENVSFHTFTLPEDRGARILVKKLCRCMPEGVVREGLESLKIPESHATAIRPSRSRSRQGLPSHAQVIVSVARRPKVLKVRSLNELCGLRISVESYVAPKRPLQCNSCQLFCNTQRNATAEMQPGASLGGSHFSGG